MRRTPDGVVAPADDTVFAATGAMNQHRALVNDLADALVSQGIAVEGFHPESGLGQLELQMRYAVALRAADQQIVFRETARGVAQQHGLITSFVPKIIEGRAGSGCHLNFSLWEADKNTSGDAPHRYQQPCPCVRRRDSGTSTGPDRPYHPQHQLLQT